MRRKRLMAGVLATTMLLSQTAFAAEPDITIADQELPVVTEEVATEEVVSEEAATEEVIPVDESIDIIPEETTEDVPVEETIDTVPEESFIIAEEPAEDISAMGDAVPPVVEATAIEAFDEIAVEDTEAVSALSAGTDVTSAFKDANFAAAVRNELNLGASDPIYDESCAKIKSLNVSYCNIYDLSGIEYFTGLIDLDCYCNYLTSLDVSGCTGLTELDCSSVRLFN